MGDVVQLRDRVPTRPNRPDDGGRREVVAWIRLDSAVERLQAAVSMLGQAQAIPDDETLLDVEGLCLEAKAMLAKIRGRDG